MSYKGLIGLAFSQNVENFLTENFSKLMKISAKRRTLLILSYLHSLEKRRIFGIFLTLVFKHFFVKRFFNLHFFSSIKMTTNPEISKRDKLKSSFNILVREEITKQNSQIEDLDNCHEHLQVIGRP